MCSSVRLTSLRGSAYNAWQRSAGSSKRVTLRAGPDHAMAITYYKRFRMEIDLDETIAPVVLPQKYAWVPWDEALLEQHAEVKYRSFLGEIDAYVFPCL